MKLLVLVNEAARGLARTDRKELSVRLLRGFNAAGAEAYVHCIDAPSLLREAKEAAATTGDFDAVIIGGGDGLVAEVINNVAASFKPIGVLPLGIHNHFARQLGMPLDLERAVAALARGEIGDAPAGEVNGRIFLNFAAVGLPGISAAADRNGSWPALLKRVVRPNDRALRVRSRGHTLARDAVTVIACNNVHAMDMFGGGPAPAPQPEGGLMNVYVAGASRPHGTAARVLRHLGSKIWNGAPPRFETMVLPELRIESTRKQLEVSIDGDVWAMRPPLSIQMRERALRVLLPGDPTLPPAPAPAPASALRPSVEVTTHLEGLELEPEPRDTAHS